MYHKTFFNCYLILIVSFQVGQLNGETTKKENDPKGIQVLVAATTAAPEKLFDINGYPMNSMSPYNPRGYGNMGNYYPSNAQYYPDNQNTNGMGWQNNPQNYPNQGNYPNGQYPSNYPNSQGNGYNQYPNQPTYTNRPGYQPTDTRYPNQGPIDVGYQPGPNYNNRPPVQEGGMNGGNQNGYNNNQQNPNYQPTYPNGPNNYPGYNYPNNQGRPMQNNYLNQPGPNGINSGSPSYPNSNYNRPQNTQNRPLPKQGGPKQGDLGHGAPEQGEGSNNSQPIGYPAEVIPNQNNQSNPRPDSGEYNGSPVPNVPNDTGIDDIAAIVGKPVTVPQETTPSNNIKFPNTTESAYKKQCVQDCQATTEYNPVCGTDNVTYVNPEKLVCARNCGLRVYLLRSGNCEGD